MQVLFLLDLPSSLSGFNNFVLTKFIAKKMVIWWEKKPAVRQLCGSYFETVASEDTSFSLVKVGKVQKLNMPMNIYG